MFAVGFKDTAGLEYVLLCLVMERATALGMMRLLKRLETLSTWTSRSGCARPPEAV